MLSLHHPHPWACRLGQGHALHRSLSLLDLPRCRNNHASLRGYLTQEASFPSPQWPYQTRHRPLFVRARPVPRSAGPSGASLIESCPVRKSPTGYSGYHDNQSTRRCMTALPPRDPLVCLFSLASRPCNRVALPVVHLQYGAGLAELAERDRKQLTRHGFSQGLGCLNSQQRPLIFLGRHLAGCGAKVRSYREEWTSVYLTWWPRVARPSFLLFVFPNFRLCLPFTPSLLSPIANIVHKTPCSVYHSLHSLGESYC